MLFYLQGALASNNNFTTIYTPGIFLMSLRTPYACPKYNANAATTTPAPGITATTPAGETSETNNIIVPGRGNKLAKSGNACTVVAWTGPLVTSDVAALTSFFLCAFCHESCVKSYSVIPYVMRCGVLHDV